MIEEIRGQGCYAKAHTDSTAALAIAVGESGSWKTRHLRRRAHSLRWRVARGDWLARHLPGAELPADIGTKALCHEKFVKFRGMMGMGEIEEEKTAIQQVRVRAAGGEDIKLKKVSISVILAAEMALARANHDDESENFGEDPEPIGPGGDPEPIGPRPSLLDFIVYWIIIPAILILLVIIWSQKNAAQRRLKEKEEKEQRDETEKRIKQEVRKQVVQDIRRLHRESSRSYESEGDEDLSAILATPERRRQERAEDDAMSNRSGAARSSRAGQESSSGSHVPDLLRAGSTNDPVPSLTFPLNAEDLYVSPGGAKYHFSKECRGLRNASRIMLVPRCENCGPVQSRPKGSLFRTHGGCFHTMRSHALAVGEEFSHFEPCLYCTGA